MTVSDVFAAISVAGNIEGAAVRIMKALAEQTCLLA